MVSVDFMDCGLKQILWVLQQICSTWDVQMN